MQKLLIVSVAALFALVACSEPEPEMVKEEEMVMEEEPMGKL